MLQTSASSETLRRQMQPAQHFGKDSARHNPYSSDLVVLLRFVHSVHSALETSAPSESWSSPLPRRVAWAWMLRTPSASCRDGQRECWQRKQPTGQSSCSFDVECIRQRDRNQFYLDFAFSKLRKFHAYEAQFTDALRASSKDSSMPASCVWTPSCR